MAKIPPAIRIFSLLWVVMLVTTSCVDVPIDRIPTDWDLNLEVDTGQGVLDSIGAAKETLTEAERVAGEEMRDVIREAKEQLEVFSAEVINLVGEQLDQKIETLDKKIQLKLVWIEHQVEQLHAYALDITNAIGSEARSTIRQAELGMRRTIQQTQDAADETIAGFIEGEIIFVNTAFDRGLSIGGFFGGIVLTIITLWMWRNRPWPPERAERIRLSVLMTVTVAVALVPITMLYRPLRAYVLTSAGKGNEVELVFEKLIYYRRPHILDFDPDVVVSSPDHRSAGLVLRGMYLATGLGMPTVTFGNDPIQVGGSDDELMVDIGPVIDDPLAANSILIQYGAAGTPTVEYSVLVQTPTPTPKPTIPPDTPIPTPTSIPLVASFEAEPASGKWPLEVRVTDHSSGENIQSWNWDFGDGSTAIVQQPPAHTYGEAGDYTIRLTVTDASDHKQTFTTQIEVMSKVGERAGEIGPFGGFWGDWYNDEMCPNSTLAYGFILKVQGRQGDSDDTALNAIRLRCGQDGVPVGEATSGQGAWGSWHSVTGESCEVGEYLIGAKMMIEPKQGSGDDTAANNVAFICTKGQQILVNHAAQFADWSKLQVCPADTAICGLRTRVEAPQDDLSDLFNPIIGDDTALNDVKFICCYSR